MVGRVVLNDKEIQRMLKDMQPDLERRAAAIAAAAGDGFESEAVAGRRRALAAVWSTNAEAAKAEIEDGVLSRAVDAGRGRS